MDELTLKVALTPAERLCLGGLAERESVTPTAYLLTRLHALIATETAHQALNAASTGRRLSRLHPIVEAP